MMSHDLTGRLLLSAAHILDSLAFRFYRLAAGHAYRDGRYSWGGTAWR